MWFHEKKTCSKLFICTGTCQTKIYKIKDSMSDSTEEMSVVEEGFQKVLVDLPPVQNSESKLKSNRRLVSPTKCVLPSTLPHAIVYTPIPNFL